MRRTLIVAAALAAVTTAAAIPAVADTAQPRVVLDNPVDFTPQVQDGTVYALALVGNTVVVGGDFTSVADAGEHTFYRRPGLFAYDLTTGAITSFAPALGGPVFALAAGPGNTVYAGGRFSRRVAQLDVGTGQRVPAFGAVVNDGDVRTLAYRNSALYLGGAFTRVNSQVRLGLARVDGTTGALDGFSLDLTAPDFRTPKVGKLAVSPDRSQVVAIGVIEYGGGRRRAQLVLGETGGTGRVSDWYTDTYDNNCYDAYDTYLRGVDF